MGLFDTIKSTISSGWAAAKNHYRTSVLNDFSIVSKATFYVYKVVAPTGMNSFPTYTLDTPNYYLPLQINPNDIHVDGGQSDLFDENIGINRASKNNPIQILGESSQSQSLEIALKYDIYDEYMVRTMDGAVSLISEQPSLYGTPAEVETENPDKNIVTLRKLMAIANYNKMCGNSWSARRHVLFIWGGFQYFGVLTSVDFRFNKFSRWGDPLAGDGTATINRVPLYQTAKSILTDNLLESDQFVPGTNKLVEGQEKADIATKKGLLGDIMSGR